MMTSIPSYRSIPSLAGVATQARCAQEGLSVEQCVERLKRVHWAFRRLHQIYVHRLVSEPVYELKMAFSLHAHYCAEHAAALRVRVGEMREPPLGLDVVPESGLEVFFDEILAAPTTSELLEGIYGVAVPALLEALQRHMAETNLLVDHPSYRVCRFAALEVEEMQRFGEGCLAGWRQEEKAEGGEAVEVFRERLEGMLRWVRGLDGSEAREEGVGMPERVFSARPYRFDPVPRRDERFTDPYNMGVHAEAFLYDPEMPVEAKPLMLFYKRLREIDVPEVIAGILAETAEKPWGYVVDLTRQLWDEARHAMMGEVGFLRAGIDWRKWVPINFTWSLALNTQLEPLERHAVLYFIEQGLMPKTGKRYEWEVGLASGDSFAGLAQDYDWADEVLHARIGRDWYVKAVGDSKQAVAYGDACWSRVLIDWEKYRAEGWTEHRNWWPALYREWCRMHGKEADPRGLEYATTYAAKRADLRDLAVSA